MRHKLFWAIALAVPAFQLSSDVQAFECPTHFAEVEMLVVEARQTAKRMVTGQKLAVLSEIREAEMTLTEARFHHDQSDDYHHSRAIIRANEARGYVMAALALAREHIDE